MDTSIFSNKDEKPDDFLLSGALSGLFSQWMELRDYVLEVYPAAIEEWSFSGPKYGWSFRIKDKKRAIVYLLPRDGFFLAALVFGEKATAGARNSEISPDIIQIIETARVYAEGRGFRIEVKNGNSLNDIKKLIDIKLKY
jgi:hypothetical protein